MTKEEIRINSKKVKKIFERATKAGKRLKKIIIQLKKDEEKMTRLLSDDIERIVPMTKRRFQIHRIMAVLKHPFTFRKRRWPITYYENGKEIDKINITFK